MPLSYAGVILPLPTAEWQQWIDRYHPVDDVVEESIAGTYTSGLFYLDLPPAPVPDNCRLGVLTWPTGASRCATFYAICNSTALDAIRAEIDATGVAQPLVLGDGTRTITATMYMVRPRPLHQIADTEQLYLLTLVDARFYWRWKAANISYQPATWAELFTLLGAAIDTTITPEAIDPAFQTPSSKFIQYRKPLPLLIDAAARSVGHRIVVQLDGTVTTVSAATALADSIAQYDAFVADLARTAGGRIDADDVARFVPASVDVVFGQIFGSKQQVEPLTQNVTLASLSLTEYGLATGVGNTAAVWVSDYVYDGTPASLSAAATLADAAAESWYLWQQAAIDFTLPGIRAWTPTGSEEQVEWHYHSDGRLLTRVIAPPWQEREGGSYLPVGTDDNEESPLVRIVGIASGPGEYANRYTVRQVKIVTTGASIDLEDVLVNGSYVYWSNVVELDDKILPLSTAAVPEQGVYTLFTAPDGHHYIVGDCCATSGSGGSGSGSGTGGGGDPNPSRIIFYDERVNCEDGYLAVYAAPVRQYADKTIDIGEYVFDRYEGCCDCGSNPSGSNPPSGSGGGGVSTTCCEGYTLPSTVSITFSGGTGDCASCLDGQVVTLTWSAPDEAYTADYLFSCSAGYTRISVYCTGSTWNLDLVPMGGGVPTGGGFGPVLGCAANITSTTFTCDPLSVSFSAMTVSGCCTGDVDATVTE